MNKKLLIILALTILIISGCQNDNDWNSVVNKEFTKMDKWAGSGFYFYESDDQKYCTYMVFGSDFPIVGYFTTPVGMSDGKMTIEISSDEAENSFGIISENKHGEVKVELKYTDEKVVVNGIEFEKTEGVDIHKYLNNKLE